MKCPSCHKEVEEGLPECPFCGNHLEGAEKTDGNSTDLAEATDIKDSTDAAESTDLFEGTDV